MPAPTRDSRGGRIVLGSRSPRRFELLSQLVGQDRVQVCPPLDPNEADFEKVLTVEDVSRQLTGIARAKHQDVTAQQQDQRDSSDIAAILTADTVIVVFDEAEQPHVLGQPPADDTWPDVVREWFERYLLRAPHLAITALCASGLNAQPVERVVTTRVTFRQDAGDWLDWYIDTGEPQGKAGGYGLQGAGSLFVDRIEGSPSNVIGLPLRETAQMLSGLDVIEHPI